MESPFQILLDGFTYRGHVLDIVINYSLILFCLLPYWRTPEQENKILGKYWLWVGGVMLALQVWVWFSADETGVSLIWSALAGVNMLLLFRYRNAPTLSLRTKKLLAYSLVGMVIGYVYYGLTLPPITTIAHTVGTLVGMGLYAILRLFK